MGRSDFETETLIPVGGFFNDVASPITASIAKGSGANDGPKGKPQNLIVAEIASTLKACGGKSGTPNGAEEIDRLVVTHSLRADGFDASEDGTGRGTPIIPIDMRQASRGATMTNNRGDGVCSGGAPGTGIGNEGDPSPTIATDHIPAIAFAQNQRNEVREMEVVGALAGEPGMKQQTYVYQCHGTNVGEMGTLRAGNGNETGGVPFTITGTNKTDRIAFETDIAGSLRTKPPGSQENSSTTVVAFQTRIARNGRGQPEEISPTLQGADAGATSDMRPCVATSMAVRRLTPRECERLQGFPDDYTLINVRGKPAADGPRYRALGNSMAVPVMRWIGTRIEKFIAARNPSEVAA